MSYVFLNSSYIQEMLKTNRYKKYNRLICKNGYVLCKDYIKLKLHNVILQFPTLKGNNYIVIIHWIFNVNVETLS